MKSDTAQSSLAILAGYSLEKFKAGLEYNIQKNSGMVDGNDLSGISVYASFRLVKKFSIFSRYDYLEASVPDDEMETGDIIKKDGQLFIAGFDYTPVKGVKIAPTYFGYAPADKSQPFTSSFGLYFELRY
jgi:hypothetical protein